VRLSPIDYSIADLDVAKQIYGPRTAYEKVNIKISQKNSSINPLRSERYADILIHSALCSLPGTQHSEAPRRNTPSSPTRITSITLKSEENMQTHSLYPT
jgi:hypothetical protein